MKASKYQTQVLLRGGSIHKGGGNVQIYSYITQGGVFFSQPEPPGGSKSLQQMDLRPLPKPKRAAVKSQGWGYRS